MKREESKVSQDLPPSCKIGEENIIYDFIIIIIDNQTHVTSRAGDAVTSNNKENFQCSPT
jgi:hypothetical protein